MINMKFSKRTKYILLILLVVLNLSMRIPSTPHEIGVDSVTIHIIANSISEFGHLKTMNNLLSIFGFYPYSYASAVQFSLSGISQSTGVTGVEMEKVIWLFLVIIGLLSIFTSYLFAGILYDDDFFKFLVAFGYSTSLGILAFTTWDSSTRGLFIVLLPLFIYILLKIYKNDLKFIILGLILIILLAATHKYVFITIPFIIAIVFISVISKIRFFYVTNKLLNSTYLIMFLLFFIMPFLTGFLIKWGRYDQLKQIISNNVRYVGIPLLFSIGGFVYISLKDNKNLKEWFFLISLLLLVPFFWEPVYGHFISIVFMIILFGISLINIYRANTRVKYVSHLIIIILLLSIGFSDFFQHYRLSKSDTKWFLGEESYKSGLWIKDNINRNNLIVSNDHLELRRIFSISEVPSLLVEAEDVMLIYGVFNVTKLDIQTNSPLTTYFYKYGPYTLNRTDKEIGWYNNFLQGYDIDSDWGREIISEFNIDYALIFKDIGDNQFTLSVENKKERIYDSGKIIIYPLK
jgi:hypothetical protein